MRTRWIFYNSDCMYGKITYNEDMRTSAPKPALSRKNSPAAGERRNARMELRISAAAKELIQRAMAISGRSVADIVYEGAKRVLDEHERMELAGADRDAFFAAVRNPPKPTSRLVAALRRLSKSNP